MENIRIGGDVFVKDIIFVVGDGSRIRFWHDPWCGGRALCAVFPDLFSISQNPDASMADILDCSSGSSH